MSSYRNITSALLVSAMSTAATLVFPRQIISPLTQQQIVENMRPPGGLPPLSPNAGVIPPLPPLPMAWPFPISGWSAPPSPPATTPGWSVVETTTYTPEPTTQGWSSPEETTSLPETTTGWSVPDTTSVPEETTGWSDPSTTEVPEETTTTGWSAPETTSAPEETTGWSVPETTAVPEETTGWSVPETTAVPEETTGWSVPETTAVPEETTGWSVPVTTEASVEETTTSGWSVPETTTGWSEPETTTMEMDTTTLGWSSEETTTDAPSTGWSSLSEDGIQMTAEGVVAGEGEAAVSHESVISLSGGASIPALVSISTGSYGTLEQGIDLLQQSSANSATGESNTAQVGDAYNSVDAGEYFEGQMAGTQVFAQNQGNAIALGQGALALAQQTLNNIGLVSSMNQ